MIAVEKITVMFNDTVGITRSPVVHICGFFELPTTYLNFRNEFNNLFTFNVLIIYTA